MEAWILLGIAIAVGAVVGIGMIVFVLLRNVRTAQGPESQGKYPQGHWMSVGMCIGIVIGCVPSLAGILFDPMSSFVAIGPAMGCGLGVALGAALERKHKDEIRPLTEEEKRTRSRMMFVGLGALALLVVSLFVVGGIVLFAPR